MEGSEADTPTGKPGNEDRKPSTGQCVRWGLALGVAIGAAAYMLIGTREQTLCHGAATIEGARVLELCGAPGVTQLLPFLVIIALLLAPDLSELAIPGLLSIKRKVAEQGARQERVEAELLRVEQKIEMRQDVHVQTNIHEAGARLEEKLNWLVDGVEALLEEEEEEEEGEGGAGVATPPPTRGPGGAAHPLGKAGRHDLDTGAVAEEGEEPGPMAPQAPAADPDGVSDEEDQRASLTLQLLWLVKNLEQYEAISRARRVDPGQKMAALTEGQQERVDRWYNLFGEELAAAKEVRNAVAHNPYAASVEELQEATRIGRRLMRILLNGIGLPTEAVDHLEAE